MGNLKSAARQIVLRPGLSATIVVMLALGIGATSGIYSLFHQVLVEPLPVPAPERLVNLRETGPKAGAVMCGTGPKCGLEHAFSYPAFRELEARQSVFTGVAGYYGAFNVSLVHNGAAHGGTGSLVSGSYFSVLNLQPALGRLIGPQDEPAIGESRVAVLSHDYWQNELGGSPGVLGRTLTVNGEPLTIIGVAPRGFAGTSIGSRPKVFMPLTLRWLLQPAVLEVGAGPENRFVNFVLLFARLRPGVSVEQASAAVNAVHAGLLEQEIEVNSFQSAEEIRARRIELDSGARGLSSFPDTAARPLVLLLAVTALVLLIVCVNLANLLFARGASRLREMAIRSTMGATRVQLAAQLTIEVAVLAALGIVLSLPVAAATLHLVVAFLPEQLAAQLAIELNGTAASIAVAASLAVALVFGLAPIRRTARTDAAAAMKIQASQSSAGRGDVRMRAVLTTAQIAFSMVLLVLAGLFARSLANIADVDAGMELESLVSFRVNPRLSGYDAERAAAVQDRIRAELAAQPGVTGVAFASVPVIAGRSTSAEISIAGFEDTPAEQRRANTNSVSPGFFDLLSIPLVAGRGFTQTDAQGGRRVAIVNESFAGKFGLGAGAEALGRRFDVVDEEGGGFEIVGVVEDAKYSGLKEDIPPQFFLPFRPERESLVSWINFYVRSGTEAGPLMAAIPRAVARVAPDLPVGELTTARRRARDDVYIDRMIAALSAGFAGLATLLAAIGIYGVLTFHVAQRARELGVRLALGARPGALVSMVLKQVGLMALIGASLGLAAAAALGRSAGALLFGLSARDPLVLTAAALLLGAVVLGASYLPARRASSIEPMEALRHE